MKLGLSFSIAAIAAGQKSAIVNAAPQLIANSTPGSFKITGPVSKALGIAVGDNIMFLSNVAAVNAAIVNKVPDVVKVAEENGIDLDTEEGQKKMFDLCSQFYIAKGVALYDKKGNPIQTTIRYSKEEKEKFLKEHAAEIVDANRDALKERLGNPNATDEELAASLTVKDVQSPTTQAFSGSKTSTTGSATGVGCQLNFSDTAIWGQLKGDLEDPKSVNRVFDVDLENAETIPYDNGKETVEITVYPINFKEDAEPMRRESAEKTETAE